MHYYVANDGIWQAENDMNMAWHAGNSYYNANFIGIEACQSMGDLNQFKKNETEAIKLAARLCKKYGITPNTNTIVLHRQVSSTVCPHRSADIHGGTNGTLNYFISEIKRYMNGGATPKPKPQKPKVDTYYHSRRVKALVVKNACNIYDGVAFSKAKKLGEAKEGKEYNVVDVWDKGTKSTDISRYKIEYSKGKYGWITGNQWYVSSSYYLDKKYGNKTKIQALKNCNVYKDPDFKKDAGDVKKGEIYTVVDNVSSKYGTPRFKLKSGLYVTARKDYWKFV